MRAKLSKIAKFIAVGIFFMTWFFNVKMSLEDPFIQISNLVLAQNSYSSTNCDTLTIRGCWNTISTRVGYPATYCGTCEAVANSVGSGGTSICWGY